MNSEQTYRVEAVRSGDWWAITMPELAGVFSQAKRLDQVESRAREAIAMMLDIDETVVGHLEIHVTPPGTTKELLETLKTTVTAAAEAETKSRSSTSGGSTGPPSRGVADCAMSDDS